MAGCSSGSVLWLDEWFALDSAVTGQASQWVLPMTRWLRTQGYRFVRVNLRVTVVGNEDVDLVFQSSNNPDAASPIALSGGASAPSTWAQVGSTVSPGRTIVANTQELNTENGLRELLRVMVANTSVTLGAFVRVEIWVTMGN